MRTLSDVDLLRLAEKHTQQLATTKCEAWGRAFAAEDGGALRCVRVLLLHCLRQQPYRPLRYRVKREGGEVRKEGDFEVRDAGRTVQVVWPKTPRDYSPEMCLAKGCKA